MGGFWINEDTLKRGLVAKLPDASIKATTGNHTFQHFAVSQGKEQIATFCLTQLPGCCGVAVSFWANVARKYQGKGLGRQLLRLRMWAAKQSQAGLMLATVTEQNLTQKHLLETEGWQFVRSFRNPKSRNVVELWIYDLTKGGESCPNSIQSTEPSTPSSQTTQS